MIFAREKAAREEMIAVGRKLAGLRLVVARGGNLSCRIEAGQILVTATGASLGELASKDIIKVDLASDDDARNPRLTSEFPLHRLVYRHFPVQVVIHCHPTLTNAYFAVYPELKNLTFESRLFLGAVPVVEQETPAMSAPEAVIAALQTNNLAVIKNHGVVAIAARFPDALYLVQELEEAVRTVAVARLFQQDILDGLGQKLKDDLGREPGYFMFSPEHIQAIVAQANNDSLIAQKGAELGLTVQLAIKMDGSAKAYKFNFDNGRISRLDFDDDAPLVISAPPEVWEAVFLGKLDPFVATMQGRMKLRGELGMLSRWYVPFSRLFAIFKQVRVK